MSRWSFWRGTLVSTAMTTSKGASAPTMVRFSFVIPAFVLRLLALAPAICPVDVFPELGP